MCVAMCVCERRATAFKWTELTEWTDRAHNPYNSIQLWILLKMSLIFLELSQFVFFSRNNGRKNLKNKKKKIAL